MKILFMGTPDIAAVSLGAIYETGETVVGVVTQPDKPKGRGYTLTPPPVKVMAQELGLRVLQPERIRTEEFAETLAELDPDLIIVVAYGKILPANVLSYPRYGCINAHASLLPKYRGAAPIQRAIMEGETETGVTAMYMDEGLDTGDMILTRRVTIEENDNFETVHDKLAVAAADALTETIAQIKAGTITRTPQLEGFTYAAKIEDADMVLDFNRTARELHCQVRGLCPIPIAYTHTPDGKRLRVYTAEYDGTDANKPVGTVTSTANGKIAVACGSGTLYITECQPEGKRRMTSADLINGRRIAVGDVLA